MSNPNIPQNGSCSQISLEIADSYFFPEQYHTERATTKMARRICANCVELEKCQDYALENDFEYGILAGMTPRERHDIKYGGSAA